MDVAGLRYGDRRASGIGPFAWALGDTGPRSRGRPGERHQRQDHHDRHDRRRLVEARRHEHHRIEHAPGPRGGTRRLEEPRSGLGGRRSVAGRRDPVHARRGRRALEPLARSVRPGERSSSDRRAVASAPRRCHHRQGGGQRQRSPRRFCGRSCRARRLVRRANALDDGRRVVSALHAAAALFGHVVVERLRIQKAHRHRHHSRQRSSGARLEPGPRAPDAGRVQSHQRRDGTHGPE